VTSSTRRYRGVVPDPIRAIVFDTNVFGAEATPNVEILERWANACAEHDAELWIPEIVALEWAEHVLANAREFETKLRKQNRSREQWGLPQIDPPDLLKVTDVVDALETAGCRIIGTDPDDALTALKDQILQTGAGTRKSEVKTGAADSAWIRSVIRENEGDFTGILVVTGDVKAVERVCEDLGIDQPRVARNRTEIHPLLGETEGLSEEQRTTLLSYLADAFDEGRFTDTDIRDTFDVGPSNWWQPELREEYALGDWEPQSEGVAVLDTPEILGVPTLDRWAGLISVEVSLPVHIEEQASTYNHWGDGTEYRLIEYNGTVHFSLEVGVDSDGEPKSYEVVEVIGLPVDQDSITESDLS
jgi:hypothetical protein